MQKRCLKILPAAALIFPLLLSPTQAAEIKSQTPEEIFFSATEEYHAGRYADSRALLQQLTAVYPATNLSSQALYLSARTLEAEGYYALAKEKLRTFLELYPRHPQTAEAQKLLKSLENKKPAEDRLAARKLSLVKAAQISIIGETRWEEVRQSFRALHRQGINTVILRVFHNRGDRKHLPANNSPLESGVYFNTREAPVIADLLGPAAKIAREEGLSIWAWMNTRRADWWPETDLREWIYSLSDRKMSFSQGISPFHSRSIARMRALYRDLARYEIDGILLQDDLNFRQWEGFSPLAMSAFRQDCDKELSFYQLIKENPGDGDSRSSSPFWFWCRWRQGKLMQYVEELIAEARAVRPPLVVAINLPYEVLTNPKGGLSWFSLDFDQARQNPSFNYFALMAYHRQMEKELRLPPKIVLSLIQKAAQDMTADLPSPQQALFKVQVLDWNTEEALPAAEVRTVLETLASGGQVSWALTPYRRDVPLGEILPSVTK